MAGIDAQKILQELKTFVGEELKSVSYKWLSRHFNIPTNYAKQILFQFSETHRGKIHVTWLLAGWTKEAERHVFQILDDKSVQEAKKRLLMVTSMHVYSVQPSQPKDATDLWNADTEQTAALFDSMVKKMEQNCLAENKLSAICCEGAKRDPELAMRVPAPPLPEAAPPKQSKAVSSKIDSIMAGKTADKRGVASASLAVSGDQAQAPKDALTRGPSSAPAQGAKGKQAGKNSGDSNVAKMWGKAPPKAAKKQGSKSDEQPAKKAKVEPATAVSVCPDPKASKSDSEEEEEEGKEVGAVKRKASKQAILDDESEEEDDSPVVEEVPASKQKGSQKGRKSKKTEKPVTKKARGSQVVDSDDDIEIDIGVEDPSQPEKQSSQAKGSSKGKEAGSQKRKAEQKAFGSIKSGPATGKKRQKVTQTVINSKGEEVTEEVWKDHGEDAEDNNESNMPSQPGEADEAEGKISSQQEAPGKPLPARSAPKKGGASPAKPAAKKPTGSGKAKPAGQKGIMSFFSKK